MAEGGLVTESRPSLLVTNSYRLHAHAITAIRGIAVTIGYQTQIGNRRIPPPPLPRKVTILHHCRCADCEHWTTWAHGGSCRYMTIRNGVRGEVEYPADAWHWCRRYRGPRVSRDVWVWRHDG